MTLDLGDEGYGKGIWSMALIQRGDSYQFGNEFELEELVWKQLPALLNLKPFKRQFSIRGQFCDILAIDEQRQLSIIELKNTEDRYVIQQLTRYYDALKHENPFNAEVDLEKPIRPGLFHSKNGLEGIQAKFAKTFSLSHVGELVGAIEVEGEVTSDREDLR